MSKILTIGEPMALFVADQEGDLKDVEHFSRFVAGAEVNFSIGMVRLKHAVTYISKLGDDPFGKQIEEFLQKNGIDTSYITHDAQYFTGMQWKQKVTSGDPHVFSLRRNSAASHMDVSTIAKLNWDGFDHIHLTGIPPALSAGCRQLVYELIKQARGKGVSISYDPNLRPGLWADQKEMIQVVNDLACLADIVIPGISEGKLLTGKEGVQEIANAYHAAGVKTVVIKLGAEGAYTSSEGQQFYTPGFPVTKVVDTVGAGDGFAVGLVSGILEGLSLQEAVRRGTAIGALAVMSPGDNDGLPDRDSLAAFIRV
ncbi:MULTISPECIES: sugar kinase [Pelosinus]|uniref:PfkB domain protein n=1 Tax=Pelosinus fermentans B4 TaxID=1149862 RepID=I9LIP2_9FIRM|nr:MULTISPECIES: sugar kinase [Pelosinus]EIW20266.1 PfkB domain protein [Pelosinus fermentans B4]EIW25896.1 PfkB domain protein [Pelosinus fermentans A11]OAM93194.1 2-dehydro-3-deoxygluconokinase [Pelosinus fermentans DSM 17108]SDQ69924.1 2-dehydro-3-deoxygluconokinase [Pelosinus fermentans]